MSPYKQYKTKQEIDIGLKKGTLFSGPLRMNRDNYLEGRIMLDNRELLIQGIKNLNRFIKKNYIKKYQTQLKGITKLQKKYQTQLKELQKISN